jgi:transcriptional regulator with XRE-family HTH domain
MASLEEQVGKLVRHHRKLAGLTQAQLAERIGRQTGAITRIETGEAAPSFETLSSLAGALGVEIRDFFGVGVHAVRGHQTDPLVSIVGKLSSLTADELAAVDDMIGAALRIKKSR